MIEVVSVYEDVARDNINTHENGDISYEMFNRLSRRAELRLIDFLSGDVEDERPPMVDLSQKNRDWLSIFIEPYKKQVSGGRIDRPKDYYMWDNGYLLGDYNTAASCDEKLETEEGCNTQIELLSRQSFYNRCNTFIEGMKPSFAKPIAKQVGRGFEFMPKDLGSVVIEYIRLPKFGRIKTKFDSVYNEDVADDTISINYEWDEFARELLIWFITDTFSTHSREDALKKHNAANGKLVRDQRQ